MSNSNGTLVAIMTIKISQDLTDKLYIYEMDDPRDLAILFASKHDLPGRCLLKLIDNITQFKSITKQNKAKLKTSNHVLSSNDSNSNNKHNRFQTQPSFDSNDDNPTEEKYSHNIHRSIGLHKFQENPNKITSNKKNSNHQIKYYDQMNYSNSQDRKMFKEYQNNNQNQLNKILNEQLSITQKTDQKYVWRTILRKLFSILDQEQKGYLVTEQVDLSQLSYELLQIVTPVLLIMEEKGGIFTFEMFSQEITTYCVKWNLIDFLHNLLVN
ncbi:unnamed protein product [Paramecium sonneborni]|uniref:Uncharacterized protein n=1 Tax=Paramecium sonneborni TaxID=65129 RepID=A0A8S1Q1B7_9CILI|nr:unnamed protein product [Paramecium sonneborni]